MFVLNESSICIFDVVYYIYLEKIDTFGVSESKIRFFFFLRGGDGESYEGRYEIKKKSIDTVLTYVYFKEKMYRFSFKKMSIYY